MRSGSPGRRRLWRGALWAASAAAATGAAGLCLALCLPWLAEAAIARELDRRGAGNIAVRVRAVSWREAVLGPAAIREPEGVLRAESVVVRYHLHGLTRGALESVRVTGARIPLTRRGEVWYPVGLDTAQRLAATFAQGGGDLPSLPSVQTLVEVACSQVEVRPPGRPAVTLPVEGSLRLVSPGTSRFRGSLALAGDRVRLEAGLDLNTGDGSLAADCRRIDPAVWVRVAELTGLALPAGLDQIEGLAACRLEAELRGWTPERVTAEAVVSDLALRREPVPLRIRSGNATLRAGPGLQDRRAQFSVRTEGIAWRGLELGPADWAGTVAGDTLAVESTETAWRAGDHAQGRVRAALRAEGLSDPLTARFQVDAALTGVSLPGAGPLAGSVHVSGTPEELWLWGAMDADPPETAAGLGSLIADACIRPGDPAGCAAAATALVWPAAAARALGAETAEAAPGPVPVALSGTASRDAGTGAWECSGTLAAPLRSLGVTLGPLQAAVRSADLDCRFAAGPAGINLSGRLAARGVTAGSTAMHISADEAALDLDWLRCAPPSARGPLALLTAGGLLNGLAVAGRVAVHGGALDLPGASARVEGIALDLPFAWDPPGGFREHPARPPPATGLSTGPITVQGVAAAGCRAACSLSGRTARLQGEVRVAAPPVVVALDQTLDWGRGRRAVLRFAVPEFALETLEAWRGGLPEALRDLRLAGRVSAQGEVRLDENGPAAACRVRLADGTLDWPRRKVTLRGLALDLSLPDALRLRTEPFQELRFAAASFGDLSADGGRVLFQLDGPHACCLERCELNWCGGRVHTQATRFDPSRPELDLVLFAENVDLIRVLSLVKGFRARGNGVLFGKLPISLRGGRVTYAQGYLYSLPGAEGLLELRTGGLLAAAVGPGHPAYQELRRAEQALENFRLDAFRLDFAGEQTGSPGARLLLAGEGADEKVPVRLNLNIKGAIEDALNVGLRLGGL